MAIAVRTAPSALALHRRVCSQAPARRLALSRLLPIKLSHRQANVAWRQPIRALRPHGPFRNDTPPFSDYPHRCLPRIVRIPSVGAQAMAVPCCRHDLAVMTD